MPLRRARHPLGLRRPGRLRRHRRGVPHRSHHCTRCSAHRRSPADMMAQEYGRYFGLNVGVFRGGCLTGPNHSGVRAARLPLLSGEGRARRARPTRSSATRASRCATTSTALDVVRAFEEFFAKPAARRGLQPRRRPRRTASRSSRRSTASRRLTGQDNATGSTRRTAQGRPHLLHQRPPQTAHPFSELAADAQPGSDHGRNRGLRAEATAARKGSLRAPC